MKTSRIALVLLFVTLAFPAFAQGVSYKSQGKNDTTGIQNLVPSGTWWRDPKYAAVLSLTMDQQKRMDDVFQQDRKSVV